MRAVAEKADKLVALHCPQLHDNVNAVSMSAESDQTLVAAATNRGRSKKSTKGGKGFKGGKGRNKRSPSTSDGHSSNLCFYHATYGEKAHSCRSPCAWPEN